MGIKAWAGCVIKVLLANEREGAKKGGVAAQVGIGMKDETVKDVMEFLDALAVMDPEERARVPGYVVPLELLLISLSRDLGLSSRWQQTPYTLLTSYF